MSQRQYLYDKVSSALKEEILNGAYHYGDLLPSEKEISVHFQVERTTVRKALEILVKEGYIEKKAGVGSKVIFKGPEQLEETIGATGSMIGFFMMDDPENPRKITQPYYADLFYWLEIECKAQNCQLVYATIDPQTDVTEILQSQNFLSVVFVTHIDRQYVEKAKAMGIHTILVNEYYKGFLTISYDNADGAYQAMKYLYEMGHKKIALISGPEQFYSSREKLSGCLKAMHDFQLEIPPQNIVEGNWEFQSGYQCAEELFKDKNETNRPSALFVFNDMMSIGAMRALKDLSYAIPEDVSVVGFDNMGQLQYTEPDLTTVDSHVAYLAKVIVENAVLKPFKSAKMGLEILIPVDLVVRKTVKKI